MGPPDQCFVDDSPLAAVQPKSYNAPQNRLHVTAEPDLNINENISLGIFFPKLRPEIDLKNMDGGFPQSDSWTPEAWHQPGCH